MACRLRNFFLCAETPCPVAGNETLGLEHYFLMLYPAVGSPLLGLGGGDPAKRATAGRIRHAGQSGYVCRDAHHMDSLRRRTRERRDLGTE